MKESKEQRLILAGKYMLDGLSFKRALMSAGYAESVARTPKAHGLSAKVCVQLALQADQEAIPATLRIKARNLLSRALDEADPRKTSLTAIARATETVERLASTAENPPKQSGPRSWAERIDWMAGLMLEYARRTGKPVIEIVAVSTRGDDELAGTLLDAVEKAQAGQLTHGGETTGSEDGVARSRRWQPSGGLNDA